MFLEREGGSVWWENLNYIRRGGCVLDERWLLHNITKEVGDERSTLFWKDS